MQRDVVLCQECEHFSMSLNGAGMCKHPNALPFPKTTDYCSMGERGKNGASGVDEKELLKLVYAQRRQ